MWLVTGIAYMIRPWGKPQKVNVKHSRRSWLGQLKKPHSISELSTDGFNTSNANDIKMTIFFILIRQNKISPI